MYTRKLDGVCFPKIEVDKEKNECVISYATFIKMAIGERLWGKWEFTFVGVCENGEKLKGLAAASLRLKTLNDNP